MIAVQTEQCTRAVLMVRPTNFGFNKETSATNTFQSLGMSERAVASKALSEFKDTVRILATSGVDVLVVDPFSEAFKNPTKFVGPIYGSVEAQALTQSLGWTIKPDGEYV